MKLPSEGERDFLQRYAPRIASQGLTIPTATLRAVGSRIRLTLELKSGEVVSGEAMVESHVTTGSKQALVVRFVALDEGSIVFPFSPAGGASPEIPPASTAAPARPGARPPAPVAPPPLSRPPPPLSPPPPAPPPDAPAPPDQAGDQLEDLFGPEHVGAPPPAPRGRKGQEGGGAPEAPAAGDEADRLPGPPAYREEPGPRAARRRGTLLAAVVVGVALVVAGVLVAVRAFRQTSAGAPAPAKEPVAALLAAADRDIAAGRLTGKEGALGHLAAARALAPADPRVRERLRLLADTLEAFAARALDRADAREAAVHLEAAEEADPGRPSLAEKRARLASLPDPDARGR
ncbi:MAG TPA: hypothetical protein VLS93_15520 [Anaeromyxobacteraceae bacterium]|nr:hypothetical protein [Anaeromyxobacteraceae bacterium]